MSITPIIFVLIILLFGFDSTGQVRTQLALKDRTRNLKFSKVSIVPATEVNEESMEDVDHG